MPAISRAGDTEGWGHRGLGTHRAGVHTAGGLLCTSMQIPGGKEWWVTEELVGDRGGQKLWWVTEGAETLAGDRGQARQSLQHPGRGAIAALLLAQPPSWYRHFAALRCI